MLACFPARSTHGILVVLLAATLQVHAYVDFRVTLSQCNDLRPNGRVIKNIPDDDARTLDLSKCCLKTVKPGLLNGTSQRTLPNLRDIVLKYNDMEYIDLEVFRPVSNVNYLYLSHNKLHQMPIFDKHAPLSSLIILELSYNQIAQIDNPESFSNCKQLELLHLDHNQISYIHPDVFKPMEKLETIDLRYNKIVSIPDGMFQLPSLLNVYLRYNSIEYVAPHAIGSNVGMLSIRYNKISFLPANFASDKPNLKVRSGAIYANNNPWHCACLLEHLADVQRAGAGQVFETSGMSPVCVFLGRQACHRDVPSALLPSL